MVRLCRAAALGGSRLTRSVRVARIIPFGTEALTRMLVEHTVVCPVLIGRAGPLETAFQTLDHARAAHGTTVLVSGEAGIGKSRLVRAMVERARQLGFVTLHGACFEADRGHPYGPVLDLVRVLSTTVSPAVAAHYFASAAAELVTLFPELRPDLTPTRYRTFRCWTPRKTGAACSTSMTDAVHALGPRWQPLMIVIEDVHWSNDATLDLLAAPRPEDRPAADRARAHLPE